MRQGTQAVANPRVFFIRKGSDKIMVAKPMGHSRQRSVDLNGVRGAAQGQGSMSTSTQNSTALVPAAEAIFDFESKEAAERELLLLRNVAVKKDEESAKLMLEVYRHRAIRKDSCKINEEIETARTELHKEQVRAEEAHASAEQWKAQMEQYRREMEHLRASADQVPGLTKELKEAKAHQAALEAEMQQWRKEAEELRAKLEAVEKEREADLHLHAEQAQSQLSPSHVPAQTSLNGHTPKARSSESFHERSAKAGRPRKNICMVPTSGSQELTPGSVTRFSDAPSSGAAPSHSKSREPESPKGGRRKPVVYAAIKKDPNAQVDVLSQVQIPGMGTAPDSGTLARLLLQRTNSSMYGAYGAEARRQQQQQQQQQYQQMGMLLPQGGMQPMAMPMHQMAVQAHMPIHGLHSGP